MSMKAIVLCYFALLGLLLVGLFANILLSDLLNFSNEQADEISAIFLDLIKVVTGGAIGALTTAAGKHSYPK